jgi:hypothetical protein
MDFGGYALPGSGRPGGRLLSQIPDKPVCRRLDLRARRPAGGETEFLSATLTDDDDADRLDANDDCKVPDPDLLLGDTGLTVEAFLTHSG